MCISNIFCLAFAQGCFAFKKQTTAINSTEKHIALKVTLIKAFLPLCSWIFVTAKTNLKYFF